MKSRDGKSQGEEKSRREKEKESERRYSCAKCYVQIHLGVFLKGRPFKNGASFLKVSGLVESSFASVMNFFSQ